MVWLGHAWNLHLEPRRRRGGGGYRAVISLRFLHILELCPQIVNPCNHSTQFALTVEHVLLKPLVQASHIPHQLSLLIDSRQLGQAIFLFKQ